MKITTLGTIFIVVGITGLVIMCFLNLDGPPAPASNGLDMRQAGAINTQMNGEKNETIHSKSKAN